MRTALLFLLFVNQLPARWWKAEAGKLSVISDGGEQQARETLAKLAIAHRVFENLLPRKPGSPSASPLPVVAYQLSTARFRAVRPSAATTGFYQSAPDRDYIVLDVASSPRVIFHEYTHLVLTHGSGPLPRWLEEGMAEFHSTVEISRSRIRLGAPVPEHLSTLASLSWLTADELSQVTRQTPHEGPDSGRLFYAESWALVHMLRFDPRYRGKFEDLLRALASGESQPQAFQRIHEKAFGDIVLDLKTYLARGVLPVVEVPLTAADSADEARMALVSDVDGELEYAQLASQAGHPEAAESSYRKLAGNKNGPARGVEVLALFALARNDRAEALRRLEQATHMPDAGAGAFFEYAMLLREDGPSRKAEVRSNLEQALRRSPDYAEAHFLLGTFAANENKHADAVAHLERAAGLFPRQSYFWHALALSYHALGEDEKARSAAQRSLDAANTAEQAEMARAAIRLSGPPAAAEPPRPDVIVPDSWRNKLGDSRLEGILERIDCLGGSARFYVRAQGKQSAFWVENPGEVLLKNLSSLTFEFRCGMLKPVPILVEYRAQQDKERMTIGVVTSLEFR